ncbi:MAG: hypothetical protein Fur0025_44270 [Oscillatoriaceae cyanobacterium]
MKPTLPLYDKDYQLWLEQTIAHPRRFAIAQLQTQDFSDIDLENLIEEIKSLGKRDKRAICSYLMRLCEHLLKVKYWQQERETCIRIRNRVSCLNLCEETEMLLETRFLNIRNFRLQIQLILKDSSQSQKLSPGKFYSGISKWQETISRCHRDEIRYDSRRALF